MRRSIVLALALAGATAIPAAAQYSVTATAEVTQAVTVAPVQLELSASPAGVRVREVASERSGSLLLEQTFVSAGSRLTTSRAVWVREGAGLRREQRSSEVSEGESVQLRPRGVDVKVGSDGVVTVTRVIAANS